MALPLSPNTAKAVEKLFPDEIKDEVVRLLTEKCADNLPNSEHEDEYDLEDLRFQVLMMSDGNIEKLREAVRMANEDWRDLDGSVVGSVRKYKRKLLGDALERNVASDWVFYGQCWNILIASAAFTSLFIMRFVSGSSIKIVGVVISIAVIYAVGLLLVNLLFGKSLYEGMSDKLGLQGTFLAALTFIGVPAALGFLLAYAIQYFF
jgi:hypothetical protein